MKSSKYSKQDDMTTTITPSATVELSRKIYALKHSGADIIELNVGEPDFPTPDSVKLKAKEAIDANCSHYAPVSGLPELRDAICHKFLIDNGLHYKPDEIIVTTGAKQALLLSLMAICKPGDEVLIPTPCWVSFIEMVKIAGAKPVPVETNYTNRFQLDLTTIQKMLSHKTKAIILNTPNNPTGAVYNAKDLRDLAQLAAKHPFYLISDEIYEKIIFGKTRHFSIASFTTASQEKTIVVNGLSKAFAMTGWRLGYAAGPQTIIQQMCILQGHMTTSTNTISQQAAITALTSAKNDVERMRKIYQKRKNYILKRLREIPEITYHDIQGTFYAFPHIAGYFNTSYGTHHIKNAADLANFLLTEGLVAVVSGDAFHAPDHMRISFANSMDNLKKGCDRITHCLSLLR
jgi:aspartate aminotransferase